MDWRARLATDDGLQLQPPADAADLVAAETALSAVFPPALRELYRVSDGVFDGPGQWFVVWQLAEVVARNRADWSGWEADNVNRQALVGFGDDGTGSPFCVPRDGGPGVFIWSAIDGKSARLAETLGEFWTRWQTSRLPRY